MGKERTELRRAVERRAGGCCEYCRSQARYATQPFSLEHVLPRSRGGKSSPGNLALACQGCNNHKYNRTHARDPATHKAVAIFNPRRQRWSEHFAWAEGFVRILGLSATGRATVEALNLNRQELVNLRRLLYEAGEHPPELSATVTDQLTAKRRRR